MFPLDSSGEVGVNDWADPAQSLPDSGYRLFNPLI